jgi:hypothetical protein
MLKYIYDKKNVGKCAQLPVIIRRRWLSASAAAEKPKPLEEAYFRRQVS